MGNSQSQSLGSSESRRWMYDDESDLTKNLIYYRKWSTHLFFWNGQCVECIDEKGVVGEPDISGEMTFGGHVSSVLGIYFKPCHAIQGVLKVAEPILRLQAELSILRSLIECRRNLLRSLRFPILSVS